LILQVPRFGWLSQQRVGGALAGPPPPFAAPLRCALTSAATPRMMGASRQA